MTRVTESKYFYHVEVFDSHIVESLWGTEVRISKKCWRVKGRPYLTLRGALKKERRLREEGGYFDESKI